MFKKAIKGFSFLIKPIHILVDLFLLCFLVFKFTESNNIYFYAYLLFSWLFSTIIIGFYGVYRFTSIVDIFVLLFKQTLLLSLLLFAYFGYTNIKILSTQQSTLLILTIIILVGLFKFGVYFSLREYRKYFGGNKRRVVVFGDSLQIQELIHFFESKPEMGYYVQGKFSDNTQRNISQGIAFLKCEQVDELYCSLEELSESQIYKILNYCEQNGIVLKFAPNNTKLPVVNLNTDYYHYQPVVSIPQMPLHLSQNVIFKRFVDIVISLWVIVFVLSWLVPLLFIVIKLESKGPLFYKHKRNGINYDEFTCYKFRSLREEGNENRLHVSKEDERVTKVGRFLRKTSIDEIPQFLNVLKGDMSIVGPRPHIPRYTKAYAKKIDKYEFIFRHSVKPGITGLAQTKGYRGEIKSDNDIINRIKFDVFYIQNWSIFMDISIMFNTIILLFKGQDNAY